MFNLNFDINDFKRSVLFKNASLIRNAFPKENNYLQEFFSILLDPIKGAHQSFGSDRSLVKVMNGAIPVDPSTWTHSFPGDEGKYRDIQALKKAIELKSSIIFDEYYRYSQNAKELITYLQEQFNCSSACNAYLSQKGGCAFPIHRDTHHVLVFALSGKKRWKLYNQKQDMLMAYNKIQPALSEEEVLSSGIYLDEIMYPGDMLYIPIGQFHNVENLSNNALHLTASLSFKPLFSLLEDVLLRIYTPSDEVNFPDKAKTILNELHPIYHNEQLGKEEIQTAMSKLFEAINEIISNEEFITSQNSIKKNNHLKIFLSPSTEQIEELAACSE